MIRSRYCVGSVAFAAGIGLALLSPPIGQAADPDALWKIVHGQCAPDQDAHENPAPCAQVDLAGGWAVLKDIVGATQFLLIPTARVTGIEDPQVLSPNMPDYWIAAWDARRFVEQRAGRALPPTDIALGINAQVARSQNQLHIHIDCIRPDVRDALRAAQPTIGAEWMPVRLAGQTYQVRTLTEHEFRMSDLFALVSRTLPPGEGMNSETMALVGAELPGGASGFDLLAGRAGVGDNAGHAEDLEDHACAVAKPS